MQNTINYEGNSLTTMESLTTMDMNKTSPSASRKVEIS